MTRTLIVTPAAALSRAGNRVTAVRWAGQLRELGHAVSIATSYQHQRCDLLIALHARKSAGSIVDFSQRRPDAPLVVALTGTDLYRDIPASRVAMRSLALATRLIVLQPDARRTLPAAVRWKTRVVYQSATPPRNPPRQLSRVFEVAVCGHLRPVKDPFRAAMAARGLPAASKIRIHQAGAALSDAMRRRAEAEQIRNFRYRWLGEMPAWRARRLVARARLLVLSSKMEGGANVVSEALASAVPVLSTRISGSTGMLGEQYPGYYEVGDTAELTRLLWKTENDTRYYRRLLAYCRKRSALVQPMREVAAWRDALSELL